MERKPTSRAPEEEAAGAGVQEVHQRLKAATSRAAYQGIASDATQRAMQEGLPPPVEVAYRILAELARARAARLDNDPGVDAHGHNQAL